MTATQNPAQDVSDAAIAQFVREFASGYRFQSYAMKEAAEHIMARARELQQAQAVGGHCQNGRGDVCRASQRDGIVCPEDSCDIDDGTRKPLATPQSSAPVVGDDKLSAGDLRCM